MGRKKNSIDAGLSRNTALLIAVFAIVGVCIAAFGAYILGSESTHTRGIDFGEYANWLAVPTFVGVLSLAIAIPVYKGATEGKRTYAGIFLVLAIIGIVVIMSYAVLMFRCWNDNSKVGDITINTAADGDFQINSAYIESYHVKDEGKVWDFARALVYEDKYRFSVDINCTNFTDASGTALLYNTTTATLQGYNFERTTVTPLMSPETQPGDFGFAASNVIIFSGVDRQDANPADQVIYYNLSLHNSAGALLATWIIHTNIELNAWTLDAAV